MIKLLPREIFKEMEMHEALTLRYAISNHGRLVSFKNKIEEGRELKGGKIKGYKIFCYKYKIEKQLIQGHLMFARLVAQYFLDKPKEDQVFVLHLDHNKDNNHFYNLQWANQKELSEHNLSSPVLMAARKKFVASQSKLTSAKVMYIKKRLLTKDRKTRMRLIAKQFGISEMQLYRIKSGENWGHIKV